MPNDSSPAPRLLTPQQSRLAGTALALLSATIILVFILGVFFVLKAFVSVFSNVLWPLAAAGVLALLLRPVVYFLQDRAKLSRVWAIVVLFAFVAAALFGVLAMLIPTLIEQTLLLIRTLPDLFARLQAFVAAQYPSVIAFLEEHLGPEMPARIQEFASTSMERIMAAAEPALANFFGFVSSTIAIGTGLAIIPIYLFFLLTSDRSLNRDLREQLSFLRSDWREDAIFLIEEFIGSMVAFFRGQIIIALIMGVLLAIGFTVIGLNFAILLGLAIGLLNIIPYLGSIIGLGTALPLAFFQNDGGLPLVLYAVLVFVLVQMVEGYLLTPRIMGQSTGLHPMVIIVAIFFWGTALDGILGMILAIPLTAFFVVAWRLAKRKYLDRGRRQRDLAAAGP